MRSIITALVFLAMLNVALLPVSGAGGAGEWSAEERLSVEFPTRATDVEIDVGENGQAIAGWDCYDSVGKRNSCWVALYDPGRGWTGGSMLGSASQNTYIQNVEMNADGTAVAAWISYDDSSENNRPIWASGYSPGAADVGIQGELGSLRGQFA